MPTIIKQRYPPEDLSKYIKQEPIMLLIVKKNNKKYDDFIDREAKTCIYSGQQSHQTFDKMILDPGLRKIIITNVDGLYKIIGEVAEIELTKERIFKNKAQKIDPKAPVYFIKYKDVYDISYDLDLNPLVINPNDKKYNTQYRRHYDFFHYHHLDYIKVPGQSFIALQAGIMLVRKVPLEAEQSDSESGVA